MRPLALVGCWLLAACSFEVDGVQLSDSSPDGSGPAAAADLLAPPDATADHGGVDAPVDLRSPPDLMLPVTGLLTGARATYDGTINLTQEGTVDWAHWGLNSTSVDDKKVGADAVGDIVGTSVGVMATQYGAFPNVSFTWTDGTPTATSTGTTSGILVNGAGHSLQVVAPADTTTRTLAVYLSYYDAVPSLEAELSDRSASDYTDSPVPSATNSGGYFKYTFTYRAASAGQKLTVNWNLVTDQGVGMTRGSVSLLAATLR